jgi:ABC-type uncharacterized transport system fused permease/ATPase subunit
VNELNSQFWQRFWSVAKPYWRSQEKGGAIALLLLLLGLSIASSVLLIWETFPRGEVISALAARDGDRFARSLWVLVGVMVLSVPILSLKVYVQNKLGLFWRRWLTHHFVKQYFADQTYYKINDRPDLDNPDQRIAEDVRSMTQQSLVFVVAVCDSVVQFLGFAGVLWSISRSLMVGLIVYALVSTLLATGLLGRVLVRINAEQLKREANFRFGLIRVREHAEAIAFYQGETQESRTIADQFQQVLSNFNRLIRWQFGVGLFQNTYLYVAFFLPFLILAPDIFSGRLELGAVQQSQSAFERIGFLLGLVVYQLEQLSAFAAGVTRLEALQDFTPEKTEEEIITIESELLQLERVTLWRPQLLSSPTLLSQESRSSYFPLLGLRESTDLIEAYQSNHVLIHNLDLAINPGESLLIVGASGVGKTSLLRAIAGLWTTGKGVIQRPPSDRLLFLPQRPYLILGSLRQQLLYPHAVDVSDAELLAVLEQVNLLSVAERWGGLEAEPHWAQILSGGEQQRLAFARLLVQKPQYAMLDEATSAIDEKTELHLYKQLQGITYISVGHRDSLIPLHHSVLELSGQGKWQLRSGRSEEQ